jgi:hypothetical protein
MSFRLYFMLVITWERNNSLSYTLPPNIGSLLRVHLHNGNHQNNKNEKKNKINKKLHPTTSSTVAS